MSRRSWVLLGWLVARMAWSATCPQAPLSPQMEMTGPIRPGTLHIVESPRGEAFACWMQRGWQAYQAGRLMEARANYEQALRWSRKSIEAWLGLAAIALRFRQVEEALNYYRQVLVLDPNNPLALAGQALLAAGDDKLLARLEQLREQYPDLVAVHVALGNLYVQRDDWPKAQRAYFEALHLDGNNPDYAYNLAVSLDHLGKRRLAVRYYTKALALTQLRKPSFRVEVVRRRLRQLEKGTP